MAATAAADDDDVRLVCSRPDKLEEIEKLISEVFIALIGQDSSSNADRLAQQFKHSLHKTLAKNVRIVNEQPASDGGKVWKTTGRSAGAAPRDDGIDYCSKSLMPLIETTVQRVTAKRKAYPEKCRKLLKAHLEKRLDESVAHAEEASSGPSKSNVDADDRSSSNDNEFLDLAKYINNNLIRFKQECAEVRATVESLALAEDQGQRAQLPFAAAAKHAEQRTFTGNRIANNNDN